MSDNHLRSLIAQLEARRDRLESLIELHSQVTPDMPDYDLAQEAVASLTEAYMEVDCQLAFIPDPDAEPPGFDFLDVTDGDLFPLF